MTWAASQLAARKFKLAVRDSQRAAHAARGSTATDLALDLLRELLHVAHARVQRAHLATRGMLWPIWGAPRRFSDAQIMFSTLHETECLCVFRAPRRRTCTGS